MAVSNDTIISRMVRELQSLQEKKPSETELRKHIGNVKLMCELMLENNPADDASTTGRSRSWRMEDTVESSSSAPEMTADEYRVMVQGKGASKEKLTGERKTHGQEHDGANGDSIFDF